jgi:hypothetical protein
MRQDTLRAHIKDKESSDSSDRMAAKRLARAFLTCFAAETKPAAASIAAEQIIESIRKGLEHV